MACICPTIRLQESLSTENQAWLETARQYDIIIWCLLGLVCILVVIIVSLFICMQRHAVNCSQEPPAPRLQVERSTSTTGLTSPPGRRVFPIDSPRYSPRPSTSKMGMAMELRRVN